MSEEFKEKKTIFNLVFYLKSFLSPLQIVDYDITAIYYINNIK